MGLWQLLSRNRRFAHIRSCQEPDRFLNRMRWIFLLFAIVLVLWQFLPWTEHHVVALTTEPRTEASPVEWVSQDDPPAYLYHGQSDGLVDIQHARLLASRLLESDVDVILDEVPGGHLTVFLTGRDIEARATAFLTRLLGG